MLPAFILYLPTCFLLSSKCSQCSFSPLYAQRSWKNKSSVACTHCALLRSGYKYLSFHTSLSTILYSLSIILIPVHLDFFFFRSGRFCFKAIGIRLKGHGTGKYCLLIDCLFVCALFSFFTAQNTRGHIIRYNLRALCTKVEWQAQQDYCLFYDTWPSNNAPHAQLKSEETPIYSNWMRCGSMPKALTRARTLSLC